MVSVIIPYYNAEKWIAETIQSCLDQGELLHEVIVVDDHATDSGSEVIQGFVDAYPQKVKYFLNPAKGANHARNFGFSKASGKYIQWLDADDRIALGKFDAQIRCIKQTSADIVYSDFTIENYSHDGKLHATNHVKHRAYSDFTLELLTDNWSCPHNYLMKWDMANQLNDLRGWNPDTKVCQDTEYFNLAALSGADFVYEPGNYSIYRKWSSESTSSKHSQQDRQRSLLRLFERYEKVLATSDSTRVALYRRQIDTNRLFALIWLDDAFKVQTNFLQIRWLSIPGVKNKILMALRYFGINTKALAKKLLLKGV